MKVARTHAHTAVYFRAMHSWSGWPLRIGCGTFVLPWGAKPTTYDLSPGPSSYCNLRILSHKPYKPFCLRLPVHGLKARRRDVQLRLVALGLSRASG